MLLFSSEYAEAAPCDQRLSDAMTGMGSARGSRFGRK
jgi:hypothetical protein